MLRDLNRKLSAQERATMFDFEGWGHNFSGNYVHDELASQHIIFPTTEALTTEGRTDLLAFAGQTLNNGDGAQTYASYINGHLQKIASGASYADLGVPEREAKASHKAAVDADAPQAEIDERELSAKTVTARRDTMFKGETLRGLLLSAFAWSTIGRIAGIASTAAFVSAAFMLLLVILGLVHYRRERDRLKSGRGLVRGAGGGAQGLR